jgi:hypothetical protein
MAGELLKNTCFHEINVAGIPDNTDITRVVSLINDKATMHTRQDGAGAPASTDNFEPEILDEARLFLITSYHEEVVGATILPEAEPETSDGDNKDTKYNEAVTKALLENPQRITPEIEIEFNKILGQDKLLEALNSNRSKAEIEALIEEKKAANDAEKAAADIIPDPTVGGKRTRRRKNHGSKRRNASNKSGRRASKQSRRRGKKQSKRHGRK